jgi:hypothetical protein
VPIEVDAVPSPAAASFDVLGRRRRGGVATLARAMGVACSPGGSWISAKAATPAASDAAITAMANSRKVTR